MNAKTARRSSRSGILLILLLSAFMGVYSSGSHFDYDLENFFPTGDAETAFYEEHRARFGSGNEVILIGIRNEEGVFEQSFLKKVDSLSEELKGLDHVEELYSPTSLTFMVRDPLMGSSFEHPYIRIEQPELYSKDSARIYRTPPLVGSFFSEDARSLCIQLHNSEQLAKAPSDSLADTVRSKVEGSGFDEAHLAGRVIGQQHYVEIMKREFFLFLAIALFMVLVFLSFTFRSWWGVSIPLVVVLLSILWTLGIMGMMEEPINLLLIILPTILFVVGSSDVVHLLSKFQEELKKGLPKLEALTRAFREIGTATFLTSVTTAAGFLTLLSSRIPPIRDFGVYTAAGVFIAFFLAFTLLPASLLLIKRPRVHRTLMGDPRWERGLRWALLSALRNPRRILLGSLLIIAASLWGISQVELDKKILEDLKEDDPVQQDFRFFEREFAGVRPFEMAIRPSDSSKGLLAPELTRSIDTIQDYLRKQYGVGSQVSPASVFAQINMARNGGSPEAYRVPEDSSTYKSIRNEVEELGKAEKLEQIITRDREWGRISGKMADIGSKRVREKNDSLHRFIATHTDSSLFEYRLTGSAHLIDRNNELLSGSMMTGLLIAFLVITLIVAFLFRSFKMILATLIPNMLPLVMVGGVMGWAGIPLKVSTSIIFTIAFGIAVDDTIHFTNRLKMELKKGKTLLYAIKRTFISTGKAILLTTFILCSGFITLIGSDFIAAYNIGVLIPLALFFAVLADLTLLPVLLIRLFGKRELSSEKGD